jgi:predicted ester cyclase
MDRFKKNEEFLPRRESHMNRIFVAAVLAMLAVTPAVGKDTHADRNKAVVRRVFTEILSQGKFEVASEIYAKDYVNHDAAKDLNFDESEAVDHGWRAAFPDLEFTVERELAEGDFVTVVWRGRGTNTGTGNGLIATGKKAEGRGISIFRVVDGRIEEEWTETNQLLILRQLGLFPARQ